MSTITHRPVKRTYSSKTSRQRTVSTPVPSSFASSETAYESPTEENDEPLKRKRLADEEEASEAEDTPARSLYDSPLFPFGKKRKTSSLFAASGKPKKENKPTTTPSSSRTSSFNKPKPKALTQLHLSFGSSIQTCKLCGLSFTRGSPDDEALHKAHCARVQRGMEWSKEEDKHPAVQVVEETIKLKNGSKGRIICFKADAKGKLKTKATTLLRTVDLALSAQPLTETTLAESKIYIFLLGSAGSSREKIVGCVVASRIETAMRIVTQDTTPSSSTTSDSSSSPAQDLVWVDIPDGGIFCDPTPLPTPMGIHRVFVSSEHRHQGIACALLSAAAKTFIYRCPLDPAKGEIAFSQPTSAGRGVMVRWGMGGVRIFEEK
ncbi:hypothetical protein FRC04_000291 [Tulasnella sp. 424]|nr:hypothetical protein FRC04_000291 [Tulasnella sp. 424]KAG8982153.1 hypothetical protein FRC05_000295 [Tulasnella sp. 425]